MARQYLRAARLNIAGHEYITNPKDPSAGLRIRFNVHQDTIRTPNWADIKITNLSKASAALPQKGDKVTLEAGYIENCGVIFQNGTVKQAMRGKDSPVDTYLRVICGDGDRGINNAHVNGSKPAGSTGKDIFDFAMQSLSKFDIQVGFISPKAMQLLSQLKYPRSSSFLGMARTVMQNLANTTQSTWSVQNGKLHFVHKDDSNSGSVTLSASTGLIGMPTETTDGIMIRCLINPQLKVNDTVKMDSSLIQQAPLSVDIGGEPRYEFQIANLGTLDGEYRILAIDWCGDTHSEEPWFADLVTIGIHGTPPASQIAQGRGALGPTPGQQ